MTGAHTYSTCGLLIRSSHPLAGLFPHHPQRHKALDPIPLEIHFEAAPTSAQGETWTRVLDGTVSDDHGRPLLVIDRSQGSHRSFFRFTYADGTLFWLGADARTLWARWPVSSSLENTAIYLTGPVLALALKLRGHLPLHASAVAVGPGAVMFVGPPQAGKSTSAAAFALAGYRVLSDDTSVLKPTSSGGFEVFPDGPRLRLWPESSRMLFGREDALPSLTRDWHKGRLDLETESVQEGPAPLQVIYFLDGEEDATTPAGMRPSPAARSVARLAANLGVPGFPDRAMRARDFERLTELVAAVPVRAWVRPRGAAPSELVKAVCADIDRGFGHV